MLPASDRKNTVSLKQVYRTALVARRKLQAAAEEPEHNLRLLVGHANFLDELSETLHNSPIERKTTEQWSDVLGNLGEDSEESDCGEDLDLESFDEEESYDADILMQQSDTQDNEDSLRVVLDRPDPEQELERPAALLQATKDLPQLKRMKHLPPSDPDDEHNWEDETRLAAQAMEVVPAALQTLQMLQALQVAEVDAIIKVTEVEACTGGGATLDAEAIQLNTPTTVASAT